MSPRFNRFDICAAHEAIEIHYHEGGWLHERPSNRRRHEATHVQLDRMGYRSAPTSRDCFDALTRNGKAIYRALEARYGFVKPKPVVTMLRTRIEVGAPRNGRPGYRWVPAYLVIDPTTGNEIHPPVQRTEAYALARTFNPSRIEVKG